MAHTAVHVWTGKPSPKDPAKCTLKVGFKGHDGAAHCSNDMGFLGTAARDPVFYSHHSNVDRMWHLWSTKLGHRGFGDRKWLDTSFVFYDEKKRRVRVKVSDVLDTRSLGYTYDETEPLMWMDSKPTPLRSGATAIGGGRRPTPEATKPPEFPITLPKGGSVEVPFVARPRKELGKLPVLVIDGIQFDPSVDTKFVVAINLSKELARQVGPQYSEYAGSFSSMARDSAGETLVASLPLPLDEVLSDSGVADGENAVSVVLVPRTEGDIRINGPVKIENQEC